MASTSLIGLRDADLGTRFGGPPMDPRSASRTKASSICRATKLGSSVNTGRRERRNIISPICRLGEPDSEPLAPEPDASERARIINLLGPSPVLLDDLIRMAGCSPAIVRTVLLELELAGGLERHGGGLVSLI